METVAIPVLRLLFCNGGNCGYGSVWCNIFQWDSTYCFLQCQSYQTERYSGGLNIRVEIDEEAKRRQTERVKKLIVHDHTYYRRELFSRRKSKGINDLVMRAIAGVEDEPKPNKGQVSETTKNSQLYKYLTTPIDDRRRTGEAFGHSMVRDIIKARPPHVTMRNAARNFTATQQQQQHHLQPQQQHEPQMQQTIVGSSEACLPETSVANNWVMPVTSFVPSQPPEVPIITFSQAAPPVFVNKDEKYWTREQCAEYEQWWQQLPSCQFGYCGQMTITGTGQSFQDL